MIVPNYTPSAEAVTGIIDGVQISLDVLDMPGSVSFALLEKKGSEWHGIGTTHHLWAGTDKTGAPLLHAMGTSYAHPDGTTFSGTALQIINEYGDRMITDYEAEWNSRLAARFPEGGTSEPGYPFENSSDAVKHLRGVLAGYRVVGNQIKRVA